MIKGKHYCEVSIVGLTMIKGKHYCEVSIIGLTMIRGRPLKKPLIPSFFKICCIADSIPAAQ